MRGLIRSVLRGAGASALLFGVYIISGSILAGGITAFSSPTPSGIVDFLIGGWSSFLGGVFASMTLKKVMNPYHARTAVVCFVTWLAGNYLVHFVFFSPLTNADTYYGLVSSAVGCVTVTAMFWTEIRPGRMPQSN